MADAASAPLAEDDLERHVRRVDPDRWLSARLIEEPAARREVLALYALDDELAKVAPRVSQPMLGEIRLQWWRDAMDRAAEGGAADHPVIGALQPALRAGRLRRDLLEALISSHAADLEPETSVDPAELEQRFDARHGAAMGLAARLLDPAATEGEAFVHAGRAWGWAMRALQDVGDAADAHARVDAALKAARPELKPLPTAAFPAVAHVALARDYARDRRPSDLRKRLRILWAAARGSL